MKWLRITAHFAHPQEDLSAAHFILEEAGSHGSEISPNECEITGYIADSNSAWQKVAMIGERLFDLGAAEVSVRPIEEEDWAEAWKQFFKRRRIGKRLILCPSWEQYEAKPDDVVIILDPGQAFGTGEHQTTQLCLLCIEKFVRPGSKVLDVGTGSGVLAIAAAKLGATVWATECEESAVEVARANFERNGVRVNLSHTDSLDGLPTDFDIIVANLISAVHVRLAPSVGAHIASGGLWVLSGVIPDNLPLVRNAVQKAGFAVDDVIERGGWLAIVCRRHPE